MLKSLVRKRQVPIIHPEYFVTTAQLICNYSFFRHDVPQNISMPAKGKKRKEIKHVSIELKSCNCLEEERTFLVLSLCWTFKLMRNESSLVEHRLAIHHCNFFFPPLLSVFSITGVCEVNPILWLLGIKITLCIMICCLFSTCSDNHS